MTLSAEKSPVLRGAHFDALPLATLIDVGNSIQNTAPAEVIDHVDDGPVDEDMLSRAYQSGFDEGVAGAEAAIRALVASALAALDLSARDLAVAKTAWEKAGPGQTVGIALEIAEMVLMREVTLANDPGRDAIVRCLTEVDPNEPAVLRLNPGDLEALGSFDDLLVDRSFELVADPAIASGDAVADTAAGSVDARLRSALSRVREELLR